MAATALAKLDRLRNHFAAFKPKPVTREDTFEGQFDQFACPPELAEAFRAALKNVEFEPPESLRQVPSYQTYLIAARAFMADVTADGQGVSQVIDPREFSFLGKLDDDPNQEKLRIWQDRLDVMRREAAATEEQALGTYAERYFGEKKAAMTTGQLSPQRYWLIRLHVNHFREWLGSEASVAGINGKVLSDYRLGLQYQTVTLFLPLSGRLDCWHQMSTFLASQSWPHDQIRLICCDTSQNPDYARQVRQWLLASDYSDVTYFALAAGTAGLVNLDRRNAAVETETNLVMCRIYNELRRRLTTDFAWVLEDDVIPRRPDQLERMLRCFHTDVATVSAPYLSRYDPD